MPSPYYLIDGPSPLADRATWEAHLADLRKLPAQPEVVTAIARAEAILAELPRLSEEEEWRLAHAARASAMEGFEPVSGLEERMRLAPEGLVFAEPAPRPDAPRKAAAKPRRKPRRKG